MPLELTAQDQAKLDGEQGQGVALAMRVVVRLANAMAADELLDITAAHIDSCLYHGQTGVDFARRLVDGGARVLVPTTLNVSSLDLLHPELYRGDPDTAAAARYQMKLYEQLGCEPTWTCAPYQRQERPTFGTHVAWAESNAIVFANSVLGARTHRYGDFIDIAAAITGRAPNAGLHRDDARRATLILDASALDRETVARPEFPELLGWVLGQQAGQAVAVIDGLPPQDEDALKRIGSAAASSGSVGLFHVVGSTPEAPTLQAAIRGPAPKGRHTPIGDGPPRSPTPPRVVVTAAMLGQAFHELSPPPPVRASAPTAVSLGTPHYSVAQCRHLVELLAGRRVHPDMHLYVSTSREVLTELSLRGWLSTLEAAGVQMVTDTCTYITPVMADTPGPFLTDSAKWAHYAPGNLGIAVQFASTAACVEAAVTGREPKVETPW